MPCVSFIDRSVPRFPVTRHHIFVSTTDSITLARLLKSKQSILEAEQPRDIVHGLVSGIKHGKQNVHCVVITYLLYIHRRFSPPENKRIMTMLSGHWKLFILKNILYV